MAREATARLYDVDHDSVVFQKLEQSQKYDQGTIAFQARPGKLIDLEQLHESIWATRLSGGTRSGLVTLEVTAVGKLVSDPDQTVLRVADTDAEFLLGKHPDDSHEAAWAKLQQMAPQTNDEIRVTGIIDNYKGYWPDVLRQQPPTPRRILVTELEVMQ